MEQRTNSVFPNGSGQIIIEVLIAFGLASILLPAILTGFVSGRSGRVQQEQRSIGLTLLKEAEEATRVFREADWSTFADGPGPMIYHPVVSGTTWILVANEENSVPNFPEFSRSITVDDAYRDANGQLAESGILDPSTKKITLDVSWGTLAGDSISTSYYLTRWRNQSFTQSDTIQPSEGGFGDWCKPSPSTTYVNLDRQGHATTVSAFESDDGTGNRILTGTGANASGPAFSNIIIQGNDPPTFVSNTDYNGPPSIKVNGVFGDTTNTDYAYLATDHQGLVILNITSTPYQKINSYDPTSGNIQSQSVYVVGNTGYLLTDSNLYIVSLSADRSTITPVGSLAISGGVKVVVDSGNQYAFVANSDPNGELKIIDVHSQPANLTNADVKNVDVDGGVGRDVFINASSTRAYLATATSVTQPEFFIIDIADKANPSIFPGGTYDTNGMDPKGVTVVSGGRAIIVGVNGHEYQVFTVTNDVVGECPNHSQNNDFLDIDSGAFGISTVLQNDGHAYSYIVTGDAAAELEIVEGGPGGGAGSGTGVFESETLPTPDPGHSVVFNSFTATSDPNLSYKISIKEGISGSCSSVTFADSDFVSFIPGPLPLGTIGSGYINPGQCLRYRVINSGTSEATFEISFNYSL